VVAASDAYIYVYPYSKQSKAGRSEIFKVYSDSLVIEDGGDDGSDNSNNASVSEEVVSCQHPAYCYTTTADSLRHCDLDKEVTEVKVQLAKDEGFFKEFFVDCWDM